jgi:hypothetical protein
MKRPRGDIGKFGLCDTCTNAKLIRNTRGSVFLLCELSKSDDRFPKYPRAPILECPGYKPPEATSEE